MRPFPGSSVSILHLFEIPLCTVISVCCTKKAPRLRDGAIRRNGHNLGEMYIITPLGCGSGVEEEEKKGFAAILYDRFPCVGRITTQHFENNGTFQTSYLSCKTIRYLTFIYAASR